MTKPHATAPSYRRVRRNAEASMKREAKKEERRARARVRDMEISVDYAGSRTVLTAALAPGQKLLRGQIVQMAAGREQGDTSTPADQVPASIVVVGISEADFYALGTREVYLIPARALTDEEKRAAAEEEARAYAEREVHA